MAELVTSMNVQSAGMNVSGQIIDTHANILPVKRAFANVSQSQTDSALVTAVAGYKLRVIAVVAIAGATATDLTFNSKPSGSGVAISPKFANGVNGGEVLPFNPHGWFETATGEGLSVTTGAGSTTGILVHYVEILP